MSSSAVHGLDSLHRKLVPVFEQSRVLKAIVFGSHARDTHDSRSDLDLILIMDTNQRFLKRHEEIESLFEALAARYPNGLPDVTPDRAFFEEDARLAIQLCEGILRQVKDLL